MTTNQLSAEQMAAQTVPLTDPFQTQFAFDAADLKIPIKKLYLDYLCKRPLKRLNFEGWALSPALFSAIPAVTKYVTQINMGDVVGLDENTLLPLKGLPKMRVFVARGAVEFNGAVGRVIASWPILIELNIDGCRVSLDAFKVLSTACSNLKALSCSRCPGLDDYMLICIADLVQGHRRLATIDLSKNSDFTDDGALIVMVQGANVISNLNISNCRRVTSLPIAGLRKKTATLKTLDLSGLSLGQSAFEWLPEGCINLENLNVSRCINIDNAALYLIGRRCRLLKSLNLARCVKISDDGIVQFFDIFEGRLEKIDLSGCVQCSNPAADALSLKQGGSLEDVRVNGLSQISADCLTTLLSACGSLKHFEIAAELKSASTHRKSMVPHISDVVLTRGRYSALEVVLFSGASMISNSGAISLVKKCRKLHTLDISYCTGVTDELLIALGKYTRDLNHLSISGNSKITDTGLVALASQCRKLKHLDLTSCLRLTDAGIKSILNCEDIEFLNIRGVDQVTDRPLQILSYFCRKLKFLDISNNYLVSKDAVIAICKRCPELVVLNCLSCNIIAQELHNAAKAELPFAYAPKGKTKLENRPKSITSFNRYVLDLRYVEKHCRVIQKMMRCMHARVKERRFLQTCVKCAVMLQALFRGMKGRIRAKQHKMISDSTYRNATILQHKMKYLFVIHTAKKKARHLRTSKYAARTMQRVFRGHASRRRTNAKIRYTRRIYEKIRALASLALVILSARALHKQILLVQKVVRGFTARSIYLKMRRGFIKLVREVKIVLALSRATDIVAAKMIDSASHYLAKVNRVCRWWKALQHNQSIVDFLILCGQTFWNQQELKKWNILIRHEHATTIQGAVRAWLWRKRRAHEAANIKAYTEAATKVQLAYRSWRDQTWFKTWRIHKKKVTARWKKLVKGKLLSMYSQFASTIQRGYRHHIFLKERTTAAFLLQRVTRGHTGRLRVKGLLHAIHMEAAKKYQRMWRIFAARKARKQRIAREHMASYHIQVAMRARIKWKRRLAEARARLLDEQLAIKLEKNKLVEEKKKKMLDAYEKGIQIEMVNKIRKNWLKYKERKEEARRIAQEDFDREQEKKKEEEEEARRKAANPLLLMARNGAIDAAKIAKRAGQSLVKMILPTELVTAEEEPKFILSVMKFQTLSMQQVGISDITMTFGEGQMYAFRERQQFMKNTKKPFFTLVQGDLSGYLGLGVCLWVKQGKGFECICDLECAEKPSESSLLALKARANIQSFNGVQIAWHENVHVEVHGICSLKQGKSGFALQDIRVCSTLEDGIKAQEDGYRLICDLLKWNFPSSLWVLGRKQNLDESEVFKLGNLTSMPWFNSRAERCIKMYVLAEANVYEINNIYERIRRGGDPAVHTIRVIEMFSYFHITMTKFSDWFVQSITPESLDDINFSEYLHMICYISMMSQKELIRLVFGAVCNQRNQTINRDRFDQLIIELTEGLPGHKDIHRQQMEFPDYANMKLKVMFFEGFERFITDHPRILWIAYQIQEVLRKKHLGEFHWRKKMAQFKSVRESLGIELIS